LGGALATLTAATAISKGYVSSANVTLVTFGGPRIGDLKFATSLNQIVSFIVEKFTQPSNHFVIKLSKRLLQ
jgi:hypothetical protein